jgi:hypothetical protein
VGVVASLQGCGYLVEFRFHQRCRGINHNILPLAACHRACLSSEQQHSFSLIPIVMLPVGLRESIAKFAAINDFNLAT